MPSAYMANERHQEHGGQETLQGADEEVHGKKKMAGNEGSLWTGMPPLIIALFKLPSFPTCPGLTPKMFTFVSEIVWDQD